MKEQVTLLHTHLIHNRFQVFIQGKHKKKRKKEQFSISSTLSTTIRKIYIIIHTFLK